MFVYRLRLFLSTRVYAASRGKAEAGGLCESVSMTCRALFCCFNILHHALTKGIVVLARMRCRSPIEWRTHKLILPRMLIWVLLESIITAWKLLLPVQAAIGALQEFASHGCEGERRPAA